jgi:23S rRNA (guanosine2251-2'-O)-methyltransferase
MIRKTQMEELQRSSKEEYSSKNKVPIIVVLDNVRSALNIGSVFRTCDAFAIQEIYLVGVCAQPPHKEIMKSALGSTETVHWRYFDNVDDCLLQLEKVRCQIIPVEQTTHSISMNNFLEKISTYPVALIFGNEVEGVNDAFITKAGFSLEIPQYGTKHSLNVAVCAGIVCWEFAKAYMLSTKDGGQNMLVS